MRTATQIRATIREKGSASVDLLREIDAAISETPSCAELWVLRGDPIQLGEGDANYPLEEAERSYREALRLDPSSAEVAEELGRFLWAVMDDAESAEPFLIRALANGAGANVATTLEELRAEQSDA